MKSLGQASHGDVQNGDYIHHQGRQVEGHKEGRGSGKTARGREPVCFFFFLKKTPIRKKKPKGKKNLQHHSLYTMTQESWEGGH